MMRFLRSAFIIARRDFTATVLSKTFIFFLLAPLFPLLFGAVFGTIGARVASQTEHPVVAVVSDKADFDRLSAARDQLVDAMGPENVPDLVQFAPNGDAAAQARHLLSSGKPPLRAVLTGGLAHPHLTGPLSSDSPAFAELRLLIANAREPENAEVPELAVTHVRASSGSLAGDRAVTAQVGELLLFLLTIFLSGMLLSQLIEEKSNKIIEVIAAAIRIDALFVGKLFAMLAASVTALIVWLCAGAVLVQMLKHGGVTTLPPPAVGWPGFLALVVIYFGMNYLLVGAAFLTIGAQASTAREVQIMSMPLTFAQMALLLFAISAIGNPDSQGALAAAVFPLSSPLVMLARAAERPEWWPHVVAIAWQALWIGLIIHFGARLFRKTVLKSGPRTRWWKRKSVA
jgi:ABC-2 type transport system permease protein